MSATRKFVAVLAAVALVSSSTLGASGSVSAAGKSSKVKYIEFLLVKPGAFTGKVLYTDGKSPAAEVPVRVWSITQKKFVYNTTTDKKGAYKLPKLPADRYLAIYGDRVSVDLRVDEKAKGTPQPLDVIIPRGKAYAAGLGMGLGGIEAATVLNSLILVGVGAGTAIAIVAATDNLGDDTKRRIVSP